MNVSHDDSSANKGYFSDIYPYCNYTGGWGKLPQPPVTVT